MDLKQFRLLLSRAVFVPLIVAAVLSVVLLTVIVMQMRAADWVDHTDKVISESWQLFNRFLDMETGLRGYLNSGDERFLQPYHEAQLVLVTEFTELSRLVSDNPSQVERLKRLSNSVGGWKNYATNRMEMRHKEAAASQGLEASILGKQLMDDIRSQQDEFIRAEENLRVQRVRRSRRLAGFAIASTLSLTLMFGLIVAASTRHNLVRLSDEFQTALDQSTKQAEALQRSEQRWITTLSSIGDAVIATDPEGRITFLNRVAEVLTGYSLIEASGRDLTDVFKIVNETTRARHEDPVAKIKRLRTIIGLANHTVLLAKNGTEIPIDDSGAPIVDANGDMIGIVLVFRDISERKRAEVALRAADRLAATGKLAASLAHEIHNPLSNVGNLLYLIGRSDIPPQSRVYLAQAGDELKRITNMSHQMLALNRESKAAVPVRITELLDGILDSLARRVDRDGIRIKRHYEDHIEVIGFPGELRQVFFNLVTYALDAMEAPGLLELTVHKTDSLDDEAEVLIRDTGSGIATNVQCSIFESFFTTKGEKGTGLGLWIAKNIVEKHHGTITFDTRVDGIHRGTEFKVVLPKQVSAAFHQ
jgi:PAS domain S-box-containing protein